MSDPFFEIVPLNLATSAPLNWQSIFPVSGDGQPTTYVITPRGHYVPASGPSGHLPPFKIPTNRTRQDIHNVCLAAILCHLRAVQWQERPPLVLYARTRRIISGPRDVYDAIFFRPRGSGSWLNPCTGESTADEVGEESADDGLSRTNDTEERGGADPGARDSLVSRGGPQEMEGEGVRNEEGAHRSRLPAGGGVDQEAVALIWRSMPLGESFLLPLGTLSTQLTRLLPF